ncbi:hypothetical protein K431DRAFT_310149 [Polychaeton citri CBS 116435]|uniref:Aspartate/glutamate racemase family protein n=1 Tax=Polychaeton citri CBS 116435 TaxID=1314669 RepID=A0A9P4US40_9PEZI|nr:hypothetical protein K431DRAFT_310149 [Polychaeton citri CBS 116435]
MRVSYNGPKSELPPLGFLAIECYFTRPPGDPWNEKTWQFPLIRETASGSSESQVVSRDDYSDEFLQRFIDAGMKLVEQGCVGIITSCGFLALAQPQLAARLPVPFASSSLIQVPSIFSLLPPSRSIGILTYDESRLSLKHLERVGVSSSFFHRVHIMGAPQDGVLHRRIKQNIPYVYDEIEAELIALAQHMVLVYPDIGALVLECTQMPPYTGGIRKALGNRLPIFDVHSMVQWFYEALTRQHIVTED